MLKFASVGSWFETRFAACSSDRISDDIRPYTKSVTDLIVGAVCVHLPTKSLYFGGSVSTMQKSMQKHSKVVCRLGLDRVCWGSGTKTVILKRIFA